LNVSMKDIPVRLLQSAGNMDTSRITAFLTFMLKPINAIFCKTDPDEFCEDNHQYIADLLNRKRPPDKTPQCGGRHKSTLPNLCRGNVTKALECASGAFYLQHQGSGVARPKFWGDHNF